MSREPFSEHVPQTCLPGDDDPFDVSSLHEMGGRRPFGLSVVFWRRDNALQRSDVVLVTGFHNGDGPMTLKLFLAGTKTKGFYVRWRAFAERVGAGMREHEGRFYIRAKDLPDRAWCEANRLTDYDMFEKDPKEPTPP